MKKKITKKRTKKNRVNNLSKEYRFQPGQSGNPKGRPKGSRNRSTIAKKVLEMESLLPAQILQQLKKFFPEISSKMSIEEIMTIKLANQTITKGDVSAYRALMDSRYGSPNQTITGKEGGPVEIETTNIDKETKIKMLELALDELDDDK